MRSPLSNYCERFLELFANMSTLTHAVSQIAATCTHAQALAFILRVLAYPIAIVLFLRRNVWAVPAACLAWLASSVDWIMMANQPSYALLFNGIRPAVDVLALGFAAVGAAGVAYCTLRRRVR